LILIAAITKNDNNNSIITDHESGEYICSNCGMVLSTEKAQQTRPECTGIGYGW
jgi:transcription initiation factor TFIIIB Brf1 subunit/transcription initiation factor TFIIB